MDGTKFWAIKKQHIHISEMRMLRWIRRNTRKDRIQNKETHLKIGVTPIDEKTRENRLKQFAYVQVRAINTPVRKNELIQVKGKEKRKSKTKNNISKSSKKFHQLRK